MLAHPLPETIVKQTGVTSRQGSRIILGCPGSLWPILLELLCPYQWTQVVLACSFPACSAHEKPIGRQQRMKWRYRAAGSQHTLSIPSLLRPSPGQVAGRILTGGSVFGFLCRGHMKGHLLQDNSIDSDSGVFQKYLGERSPCGVGFFISGSPLPVGFRQSTQKPKRYGKDPELRPA